MPKLNELMITRSAIFGISSLDEKTRSIEAVFATEAPVMVFDYELYRIVPEVLLMDGMSFPDQIPFLDSHNRSSIKDQYGSGRDMHIAGDKLIGRLYFSSASDAEAAYMLAREGHVTDVSIGYTAESVWVNDGESYTHNGRTFKGPLKLSLKTQIKEISLTSIGADEMAKIRSEIIKPIDEQVRAIRSENDKLKLDLENAYSALKAISTNERRF